MWGKGGGKPPPWGSEVRKSWNRNLENRKQKEEWRKGGKEERRKGGRIYTLDRRVGGLSDQQHVAKSFFKNEFCW